MAVVANARAFARIIDELPAIQASLRSAGLAGWLLYDLHQRNPIAARLLGQGDLTRRYFVYIPAAGEPTAVVHAIEVAPWSGWPWRRRVYAHWSELGAALAAVLEGGRVAMEYSEQDAVPAIDLVPAGVVELVRAAGVDVVGSGDLITLHYSRWDDDDAASHRRTAAVLADVAAAAFAWLARGVADGPAPTEGALRDFVLHQLAARGAGVGADCIGATGRNAADPHYHVAGAGATFQRGDIVLLDLWSKESSEGVYADQTWMACLDAQVPVRAAQLFAVLREARDAAVEFIVAGWAAGREIRGRDVDDSARDVVRAHGHAEHFIHRTGHSIDRATHGAGPNIDNYETCETRRLVAGIGFSIEPGIYIPGEIGLRTEINVYIGDDGPEVTTPRVQHEIAALFGS